MCITVLSVRECGERRGGISGGAVIKLSFFLDSSPSPGPHPEKPLKPFTLTFTPLVHRQKKT